MNPKNLSGLARGVRLASMVAAAETKTRSVFERLAEHEIRFERLNVLRKGWREQCARPDADPAIKQILTTVLDAIDNAVTKREASDDKTAG